MGVANQKRMLLHLPRCRQNWFSRADTRQHRMVCLSLTLQINYSKIALSAEWARGCVCLTPERPVSFGMRLPAAHRCASGAHLHNNRLYARYYCYHRAEASDSLSESVRCIPSSPRAHTQSGVAPLPHSLRTHSEKIKKERVTQSSVGV